MNTNQKYKILAEIMALAIMVNEKTKVSVFVDYSGHIDKLCISVYENGWNSNCTDFIRTDIYTNGLAKEEAMVKKLNDLKNVLNKILIAGKVDKTKLPYEIEIIEQRNYSLVDND